MRRLVLAWSLVFFPLAAAWAQPAESAFGLEEFGPSQPRQEEAQPGTAPEALPEAPPADLLASLFGELTMSQQLAQMMLVRLEGVHSPATSDLGMLQSFMPGGVVIGQIADPAKAQTYAVKVRGVERVSGIPLLVGADIYELSRPQRTAPSVFAQFPSLLALAATRDLDSVAMVADVVARHMRLMGFNLHLGPRLSLAPNLPGAAGAIHCLGSDPKFAAEAGVLLHQALEDRGIIAAAYGFPGGAWNRDGNAPAVLLTPRTQLLERDVRPFQAVVESGARAIHVGPTLAPTLDSNQLPACLSRNVITGLLRGDLGFEGVVIAGPMDHPDIAARFDPAGAALLALHAGADMMYWSAPAPALRAALQLEKDIQTGDLPPALVGEHLARILALKQSLLEEAPEEKAGPGDLNKLKDKDEVDERILSVERRAITLVQNRGQVLPLTKNDSGPVGVAGVTATMAMHDALEKHLKKVSRQRIASARHLGEIQDFEIERIVSRVRGMGVVVCVFTDQMRAPGMARLIEGIQGQGARVVAVLLGYPGKLEYLARADAVVLAYCEPRGYDATVRAVSDVLVGKAPVGILRLESDIVAPAGEARTYNAREVVYAPAGRLPVAVSEQFPVGMAVPYAIEDAIKKVEWDFGNGHRVRKESTEYAYPEPGRYPLTLKVTDSAGDTISHTFHVRVAAAAD